MRIGVIGTGYVGLVSGTCFAEFGIDVTCVDRNEDKINALKNGIIPIYEPGLEDLVERQTKAGRLKFTTNLAEAVKGADAVFIAVGTPPRNGDEGADLSQVFDAAREIAQLMDNYLVIVTKSTVPVGTARKVIEAVKSVKPNAQFDVVSNPEFLREGSAIEDFMRPDRVVIGAESEHAANVMRVLYRPLYLNETPIVITSLESSELTKYAANAFLATKITFINEIARLCEKTGANVQDVARGMGLDGRIGRKFLHAGPGYGGSCFPKDTKALVQTGEEFGAPQTVVAQVVAANTRTKEYMAEIISTACGGSVAGKRIGVLGVSFKPNTDDMRDAPSLTILPLLQQAGASVAAFDPVAMKNAKTMFTDIDWKDDVYSVTEDADALVIITEWNEFRALDLGRIKSMMKTPCLVDLRNIYKLEEVQDAGFHYVSIGRQEILPEKAALLKQAS